MDFRTVFKMSDERLNLYGDRRRPVAGGRGMDIASQRVDELDRSALDFTQSMLERHQSVSVLDAGCGLGAMAVRFAKLGATVLAVDESDQFKSLVELAFRSGLEKPPGFEQDDLRSWDPMGRRVHIILCQRTLHYLSHQDAGTVVRKFLGCLEEEGRMFLSVSGLESELGEGYPGIDQPVIKRYAPLSPGMAAKHGIEGPVCLYRTEEFGALVKRAGGRVIDIFRSPFGNVKLVAEHG